MLTPHLIQGKTRNLIGVIRHPADQRPAANRHDVVWIAGEVPKQRGPGWQAEADRLTGEAVKWIERVADQPEAELAPVPGYGPRDRQSWREGPRPSVQRARENLLQAMRRHVSMKELQHMASRWVIDRMLRANPDLHAFYRSHRAPSAYRLPARPPAPNHIKWALARALDEARQHPDSDYWRGRAALAAEMLRLWQRDEQTEETPDGQTTRDGPDQPDDNV